jgi:serine/threonine protein kinase
MAVDPSSWESLEASEASRANFGPISWRLLALANIDRRDVVSHSDRVRYVAIGLFMLLFGLYAFGGWLAFLSSAGVRHLGRGGLEIELVGAALGAAATLVFDRALVGSTKPNLDYQPVNAEDDVEVSGTAQETVRAAERGQPLPSVVAKPSRRPIIARVAVAIVIGLFATQAVDLRLFAGDINSQRAHNQISALEHELAGLVGLHNHAVTIQQTAVHTARKQQAAAETRESQARRGSGGICRRHLFDSQQPSRCAEATKSELAATAELAQLAEGDPANPATPVGGHYVTQTTEIKNRIWNLRGHPSDSRSVGSGPAGDTADLVGYVISNPGSAPLYLAVLLLALLLDLAAILLKLAGFDSEYERRQALRRWLVWTRVNVTESRRYAVEQGELRQERREEAGREAAEREKVTSAIERDAAVERVIRAAYAEAHRNRYVRREAERLAVEDLLQGIRRRSAGARQPRGSAHAGKQEYAAHSQTPAGDEGGFSGYVAGDMLRGRRGESWTLTRSLDVRGAHATIWEAYRTRDKSIRAAIKVMPVDERGPSEPPSVNVKSQRAQNDLRWLEQFSPKAAHLPQLLDASDGTLRGGAWHATAWAPRGTLHDHYSHNRPRALAEILNFTRQVIDGLIEAGEVVHGDLKPANLLLFEDGKGLARLVITDWGLARSWGQPLDIPHHEIGTIEYAAPDTLDPTQRVHVLDDLFSLGAVIWWCCTGYEPGAENVERPEGGYTTPEEYAQALAQARAQLPKLHTLQGDVPPQMSAFLQRLLSESRNDRVLNLDEIDIEQPDSYLQYVKQLIDDLVASVDSLERERGAPLMVGPRHRSEMGTSDGDGGQDQSEGGRGAWPPTQPTGEDGARRSVRADRHLRPLPDPAKPRFTSRRPGEVDSSDWEDPNPGLDQAQDGGVGDESRPADAGRPKRSSERSGGETQR